MGYAVKLSQITVILLIMFLSVYYFELIPAWMFVAGYFTSIVIEIWDKLIEE